MSFKAIHKAYQLDAAELSLTSAEKFVLITYAYHANTETKLSFPRHSTVAKETLLTERFVRGATHKLVDLGLLHKVDKMATGTVIYHVDLSVETLEKAEARARKWAWDRHAQREKEAWRKEGIEARKVRRIDGQR